MNTNPETPSKFNERARQWGNKTANLQELQELCRKSNSKAIIPTFCPLSNEQIQKHLDTVASCWRILWAEFQKKQLDEKDEIKQVAAEVLTRLRTLIIQEFNKHPLKTSDLTSFLQEMKKNHSRLMVRSTGNEDSIDVVNPGGNESITAVSPEVSAVSNAMGQVIASYFSEKSLKQRLLSGKSITNEVFVPVLIQCMIGEPLNGYKQSNQIIRSGIMYTGLSNTRIQVAPGHGELVAASKAEFDTFTVTREKMVYSTIAKKSYRLVPSEEGLVFIKNPQALSEASSLSATVILRLAELGQIIEQHYHMPMDVEFIYDPQIDTVFLVQARPISQGDVKQITPCSVPPGKMEALKNAIQRGEIKKHLVEVVTPAGYAAKVITQSDHILIAHSIELALAHYLKKKNAAVLAVIINSSAPATSHAAAQFSLKAIPVLYINNYSTIEQWMKQAVKPALLIDPQRNQLLEWGAGIADSKQKAQNFLEQGLFMHPMAPLTLYSSLFQKKTLSITGQSKQYPFMDLRAQFSKIDSKIAGNRYTQLIHNIEIIEAITANASNLKALTALNTIRVISYRLTKSIPVMARLFQHILIVCEEVEQNIKRQTLASIASSDLTMEHLSLVAILKSLIMYPGSSTIISDSLIQVMQNRKSYLLAQALANKSMSPEQLDYFTQFLKLLKIAFNEETKTLWVAFVKECIKEKKNIQKLAFIVMFSIEHHIESTLINQKLSYYAGLKTPMLDILNVLYSECIQAKTELSLINFEEKKNLINAWSRRIDEWSNPAAFEMLWQQYEIDIIPLIEELRLIEECDWVRMSALPAKDKLSTIPGSANLVFVMIEAAKADGEPTQSLFYVNKAMGVVKAIPLKEGDMDFIAYNVPLPQDVSDEAMALSVVDWTYITSDFGLNRVSWSLYSTGTLLPSEILTKIQTDVAYVLSDNVLYFVNKKRGICVVSNIKENQNSVAYIKKMMTEYYQKEQPTLIRSFQLLGCGFEFSEIKKDYNYLDTPYSQITQNALCSTVINLANLMDKVIKSVKSSPDYVDTTLLLKRFVKLLEPYHDLMRHWMMLIPEEQFDDWSSCLDNHQRKGNKKFSMLNTIKETFDSHCRRNDVNELATSGEVSIAAIKIGSAAAFSRQFNRDKITLEDLFSLFHQNILSAITILNNYGTTPLSNLPSVLHPLCDQLVKAKLDLISFHHTYPHMQIDYNLPLGNHSASFIIDYDQQTQHITLSGHVFGLDLGDRMYVLSDMIEIEGLLSGFEIKKQPYYSEQTKAIEFSWKFDDRLLQVKKENGQTVVENIGDAIKHYGKMTNFSGSDNAMNHYLKQLYWVCNRHSFSEADLLIMLLSTNKIVLAKKIISLAGYLKCLNLADYEKLIKTITTYNDQDLISLMWEGLKRDNPYIHKLMQKSATALPVAPPSEPIKTANSATNPADSLPPKAAVLLEEKLNPNPDSEPKPLNKDERLLLALASNADSDHLTTPQKNDEGAAYPIAAESAQVPPSNFNTIPQSIKDKINELLANIPLEKRQAIKNEIDNLFKIIMPSKVDAQIPLQVKADAIEVFMRQCEIILNGLHPSVLKALLILASAITVTVISALVGFGIGFALGAWTGPGAFITGLISGYSAAVAVASTSTTLGVAVSSLAAYSLLFKPSKEMTAIKDFCEISVLKL